MSLTAPVSQGDFHYAHGDLYVTSAGSNRHRRATTTRIEWASRPPPGQSASGDPPAHWYEAQLLHYGLPPSKVKGTAFKRLLDALNAGSLSVPPQITDTEKSLKKKWEANEREAKK